VPTHIFFALLAALLLNLRLRGIGIFRTLFYLPYITPLVANSILWLWIFNTDFGLANWLLSVFHLPAVYWLQDPRIVKVSLVMMSWWTIGGQMVILLAGPAGYSAPPLRRRQYRRRHSLGTLLERHLSAPHPVALL